MSTLRFTVVIIGVGLAAANPRFAAAQDYPTKPIRFVASGIGGGSDFTARLLAPGISNALGQPVVIENRSGVTQGEIVAKAPPDGYTVLVCGGGVWLLPLLQQAPYDFLRDFSVVTMTDTSPNIMVVHPSMPVMNVKELIALAKARPGQLNYGSTNPGGSIRLATELFKSMAGIDIVNIPYKATGLAVTDVLSGQVQLLISTALSVMPQIKSGRLRGLAVTSAQPSALAPGLPTVAASGLPGYEAIGLSGAFVPAKTPAAIINRLNQEFVRNLGTAEAKERFLAVGGEPAANSSEQATAVLKADIARWSKVIKEAGIKAE